METDRGTLKRSRESSDETDEEKKRLRVIETKKNETDLEDENRKDLVDENRKDSVDENRKDSVDESRKDSVDEKRKDLVDENRKDSFDENRKDSVDENRKDSVDENRKDSVDENRKDSVDENRKDSVEQTGTDAVDQNGKVAVDKNQNDSSNLTGNENSGEKCQQPKVPEILLEIRKVHDDMARVRDNLQEKQICERRSYTQEAKELVSKTKEVCNEVGGLIGEGIAVKFTDLPEDVIPNITSYLEVEDKKNLRLVSRSLSKIIHQRDKSFRHLLVELTPTSLPDDDQSFRESNKMIIVVLPKAVTREMLIFLEKFSSRVLQIVAPAPVLHLIQYKELVSLENITALAYNRKFPESNEVEMTVLPPQIFTYCSKNIYVLDLVGVRLDMIANSSFTLPSLSYLNLSTISGQEGLLNLLSSCSKSLQELTVYDVDRIDFSNLDEEMESLYQCHLINIRSLTGLKRLLSLASDQLYDLNLQKIINEEEMSYTDLFLPNLRYLFLRDIDLAKLKDFYQCVEEVIHIEVVYDTWWISDIGQYQRELGKLLSKSANTLETFRVYSNTYDFDVPKLPDVFPWLADIVLIMCQEKFQSKLLTRCPSSDYLWLRQFKGSTLYDNTWWKLSRLAFDGCLKDAWFPLNWRVTELYLLKCSEYNLDLSQFSLKKLTVERSVPSGIPGLKKLLRQVSSTLEKLTICSGVLPACINFEMKSLKVIDVGEKVTLGPGFAELLRSCSQTLRKLSFPLPDSNFEDSVPRDLELPNLRILHTHPKPTLSIRSRLASQLPDQVDYWFFPLTNNN